MMMWPFLFPGDMFYVAMAMANIAMAVFFPVRGSYMYDYFTALAYLKLT